MLESCLFSESHANIVASRGTQGDASLLELLSHLRDKNYHFTTTTPATHRQILARKSNQLASNLRDIFGWSMQFDPEKFSYIATILDQAGCLEQGAQGCRSTIRVSTLQEQLFIHSAFPTNEKNAVFFGPDTYRFVAFLKRHLPSVLPSGCLVDIGTGSGAGGITVASHYPGTRPWLSDLNPQALRYCRVNAAHAQVDAHFVEASGINGLPGTIALAVANPPFIADTGKRLYRDGGEMRGARLSYEWAVSTMERLAAGGMLLLYTGVAIVDGQDPLYAALKPVAERTGCTIAYEELDPDIFGNELSNPAYMDAERLAAVGFVITRI